MLPYAGAAPNTAINRARVAYLANMPSSFFPSLPLGDYLPLAEWHKSGSTRVPLPGL